MENYLIGVALKKLAWGVAKGMVTFLAGVKSQAVLRHFGVTVDMTQCEDAVAAVVLGGLEFVHDWARKRFPSIKWI